jgi:hypothetical protein
MSGKVTVENLENIFSYHAPKADQPLKYVALRLSARSFAQTILDHVPDCQDREDAIRKIREAVMIANAAVALDGEV